MTSNESYSRLSRKITKKSSQKRAEPYWYHPKMLDFQAKHGFNLKFPSWHTSRYRRSQQKVLPSIPRYLRYYESARPYHILDTEDMRAHRRLQELCDHNPDIEAIQRTQYRDTNARLSYLGGHIVPKWTTSTLLQRSQWKQQREY
jgi:hypothetical protein